MDIYKELAAKNEEAVIGSRNRLYCNLVNRKIRARYSQSAENALLRKVIAGVAGAQEEFAAYNAFAEQCKAEAKAELGIE